MPDKNVCNQTIFKISRRIYIKHWNVLGDLVHRLLYDSSGWTEEFLLLPLGRLYVKNHVASRCVVLKCSIWAEQVQIPFSFYKVDLSCHLTSEILVWIPIIQSIPH